MIRKKLSRFLALVLCLALMLPLFQIPQASALPIGEGVVCSSRYGRNIVGYDGGTYYPRDSFPILYYREDGSTYFQTFTSNGKPANFMYLYTKINQDEVWSYCIESGVSFVPTTDAYVSKNGENSQYFVNLPIAAQRGIMLALLYGYENGKPLPVSGINADDYYFATQVIIWEYQQQLRKSPTQISDYGPIPWDTYYSEIKGRSAERAYDWMLEQMAKHSIVPSFTSQDIFTAPTYTLEYDADSRQYALTLTDTNQTGIDLEAMSETAGISVSRNGNSYTFTTSNIINNPVCIQYEKKFSFHGAPMLIWGSPGHQTMATGAEDPVRFYAQFKTESTGSLEIIKSGDDDVSVAGWQFNISGNGIDMNVTVGEDGVIMVPDLTAGRYTVTEINVPDYYQKPSSQNVDVIAGQITEVRFYNKYQKGGLTIQKDSELDKMTAGVQFRVTGVCDNGKTYNQIHTTSETGVIQLTDLYTGSYTVTELGLPGTGIPSWIAAPSSQTIRVNGGSTGTLSFHNALKRGNLEIQKQSEDGQFISGIGFRVYGTADCGEAFDQVFYTSEDGSIHIPDMLVGTYFVKELDETVNGNYYIAATQIVAIKEDTTTTTQPYNKLKRVPLRIVKESYNGKNLGGIQFLVQGTTAAGSAWEHVYTTDEYGIVDVAEFDSDAPPCGTYTVSELESSVNIGYIIPSDKNVTLTYGEQAELYFYNAPKMGSIKVIKTDDLNNHFIEGRTFRLYGTSDSGDTIDLTAITNSQGVAEFIEVPIGNYTLSEEDVPLIFVRPDPDSVQVVYAQTQEANIENLSKKTSLTILKSSTDMQAIEGVPFRIVGIPLAGPEFAYDQTFYTDAEGKIEVHDLLIGNYSVMELDSDVTIGYIKPESQNVTLEYGKPATVEFFNRLIQNDIRIVKYDGFNDQPLEGVLFGLYDENGQEVFRGRTSETGELLFENLRYGKYTLKELEGKTGYYPLEHDIDIEVVLDGITQEIPLVNERKPCEIQIYKTDGTTKLPLAGAKFGLYDAEGDLLETGFTNDNGYISFTPQPWGQTYSIREISAPSGYLINDQIKEFEIKAGDAELLFSFINEREPCDIQVIKLDGTNRTPLEGVEFGLYSEAGELLDTGFTQADGKLVFEDVPWGAQYQIRELSPLTGYLPLSPVDVTVRRGDKLIELETVNERRPVEIQVLKTDGETEQPLGGVEFGLYTEDGSLIQTGVSDENGRAVFSPVPWGQTVYLKEINAKDGYLPVEQPLKIELHPEDQLLEFSFENYPIRGDIKLLKIDAATGEFLSGVVFGLFDQSGKEVARGITEDGVVLFEDIRYGNYELRELEAKEGYQLLEHSIPVTVSEHGVVVELTAENNKIPEIPETGSSFPLFPLLTLAAASASVILLLCSRKNTRKEKKS